MFREALRNEASVQWKGRPLLGRDLYIRILWFHSVPKGGDVDNILKNILDALKEGTVYADDGSIVQITACSIDTRRGFDFREETLSEDAPEGVMDQLLKTLQAKPEHVLYIEVGPTTDAGVAFGPVDGGVV